MSVFLKVLFERVRPDFSSSLEDILSLPSPLRDEVKRDDRDGGGGSVRGEGFDVELSPSPSSSPTRSWDLRLYPLRKRDWSP